MQRTAIQTATAPEAIGPYSQAIRVGTMVFTSGQIPLDPATGKLVEGDIGEQARRVLDNLEAVLAAAGAGFGDVVKTTIYLIDMGDFGAVNAVYGERFAGAPPARSTVAVARLPKDARIEIDMVAVIGGGS
jgi:2-iminobutanoate/2-iminopropanoate deaminase